MEEKEKIKCPEIKLVTGKHTGNRLFKINYGYSDWPNHGLATYHHSFEAAKKEVDAYLKRKGVK